MRKYSRSLSLPKRNSDRTYLNRRNSAFWGFFRPAESEKFRFFKRVFSLFLCCYCSLLIKYLSSSSNNRTRPFNINVNTGKNRKNSDSPLIEQRGIVPAMRRPQAAIMKGTAIRTARLITFNSQEAKLLLYSGAGTRARRKNLKTSLPLVRFLRSLDALFCYQKEVLA